MGFAAQAYNRPIPGAVATVGVNERSVFIKKTYAHLAGAVGTFVLLEYLFLKTELAAKFAYWAWNPDARWNGLIVFGLFIFGNMIADKWARSDVSRGTQYLGLAFGIAVWTLMFAPLLYIISAVLQAPDIIAKSAVITMLVFGGLTATVFLTKKDFSFLRGALTIVTMVALGAILASFLFGFALGTFFAAAMVLLASGYILYYTSQIMAHYRPTQYVSAALSLFGCVAMLFWYIIHIVWSFSGE